MNLAQAKEKELEDGNRKNNDKVQKKYRDGVVSVIVVLMSAEDDDDVDADEMVKVSLCRLNNELRKPFKHGCECNPN